MTALTDAMRANFVNTISLVVAWDKLKLAQISRGGDRGYLESYMRLAASGEQPKLAFQLLYRRNEVYSKPPPMV
jgi:hypothetical protein